MVASAEVLTLQVEGAVPDGRPDQGRVSLSVGDSASIGACGCGSCGYDLVVGTSPWTPLSVQVAARAGHWTISNGTDSGTVRCRDLEDDQQQVLVTAGRFDAVIPFELAVLEFPDTVGSTSVLVFGPEPRALTASGRRRCPGETAVRPDLRRDAAYFAVLEELCHPWQTRGEGAKLPTSAEVAARLSRRGLSLSRRAVDHHVEHLLVRLGLATQLSGTARGRRREALVRAALRLDLVGDAPRRLPGPAA